MKRMITRVILLAGWLVMLCAHAAHAGVLGIGKTILKANPWAWFWAGIEGLMKLLEAHPTTTKTILGTSIAMQLIGIIRGKGGFPWTLFLLALTLLAAVALFVMLRRR
jgi:RsiW-degrading membrane proteinase PrsW (M82 family)